jgi:hypothetical protein
MTPRVVKIHFFQPHALDDYLLLSIYLAIRMLPPDLGSPYSLSIRYPQVATPMQL